MSWDLNRQPRKSELESMSNDEIYRQAMTETTYGSYFRKEAMCRYMRDGGFSTAASYATPHFLPPEYKSGNGNNIVVRDFRTVPVNAQIWHRLKADVHPHKLYFYPENGATIVVLQVQRLHPEGKDFAISRNAVELLTKKEEEANNEGKNVEVWIRLVDRPEESSFPLKADNDWRYTVFIASIRARDYKKLYVNVTPSEGRDGKGPYDWANVSPNTNKVELVMAFGSVSSEPWRG